MKKTIAIVFMAIATSVFGSQQTQVAEAIAQHIREVQRARVERIKREGERAEIAERANIPEIAHPLSKNLEEYRARRKASLAAKEAEKNKLLVKKLTKESASLRRKNEHLRKELDKTINELAEYRSQAKHLSEQLRSLPKSLGRGTSSGPARRRK